MDTQVLFNAKLPVKITKKRKWFVASCPILDIVSQGETEASAKKNLKEALSLFFLSCFERGTLDAVLKQCGFRAAPPASKKSRVRPVVPKEDYLNIPIPFLVDRRPELECHA